jgi:hypothetical protein
MPKEEKFQRKWRTQKSLLQRNFVYGYQIIFFFKLLKVCWPVSWAPGRGGERLRLVWPCVPSAWPQMRHSAGFRSAPTAAPRWSESAKVKRTVSRDFRLVFFMNQFLPSPLVYQEGRFEFFRQFAKIFAAQGAPTVSLTPVANGKNLQS